VSEWLNGAGRYGSKAEVFVGNCWMIRAGRDGSKAEVFVGDCKLPVSGVDIHMHKGKPTQLTLTILPDQVQIDPEPDVTLIVGHRVFRVVEILPEGS
jgi:hypothetical protein